MTVAQMLLDMKAAHAARRQYHQASERWAERAIRHRQAGNPLARAEASMANRVRRMGVEEAE